MAGLTSHPSGTPRPSRAAVLDWLQANQRADQNAISRAELVAKRAGQPVEQVLNQLGSLSDDHLVEAYAAVTGFAVWDPMAQPIALASETLGVSVEFLRRARIAPIRRANDLLTCAACDPLNDEALSGLVFATGCRLEVLVVGPSAWRRAFDAAFAEAAKTAPLDERRLEREVDQVADGSGDGAGARLVASAFEAAIAAGASDIHFEPRRHDLLVRLRIDGRLVDFQTASSDLAGPAVSRVKVIANLDIGERRLPQDGRTTFVTGGRPVDVRVATSPTVFGESAVLRILDRTNVTLELNSLGLSAPVAAAMRRAAAAPHGLFLMTGPTGSGKTTTLYALLATFVGSAKKILSIEDPVEYHFDHVSQTQVAPQLGLTFAAALRSFLRQDPDVILVGEIRDPETAAVAVQAAMTGHFVLASVHANDALAIIPRLRDMGVEPYQLAASLRGAAAQRLVRRLCEHCRRPQDPTEVDKAFAASVGVTAPRKMFASVGCPACKGLGFRGRLPIAEAFLTDEGLLRRIAEDAVASDLKPLAETMGLKSMAADGLDKAVLGLTTIAEVAGAVHG